MSSVLGKLFIVGTPIGNIEDITLRALRVLREADLIAAEDTRHTGLLLSRYDIRKPLISYHEFNEARRAAELLGRLQRGESIALVSDAGMPTMSDPGLRLIKAAADLAITIDIVPGPSAITMAVAASGLHAERFLFYGFLPHKPTQRQKALAALAPLPYALVFFESPYRLVKSIADMQAILGNRAAAIARELTKKFEEIMRGDLADLMKRLENRSIKGEITIVVEPPEK
jgi:16S rRNA (cytidine1402-2'-O)-methyltransferase